MKKNQLIEALKEVLSTAPILTLLSSILFFIITHSYNIGFFKFFSVAPYYFTLPTTLFEFLSKFSIFLTKGLIFSVLLYLFYSLVNYLYSKDKSKKFAYIVYYFPTFFMIIFTLIILYSSTNSPMVLISLILMAILIQFGVELFANLFTTFRSDIFKKQAILPSVLNLFLIPKFNKSKLRKVKYSIESYIKSPKQVITLCSIVFLLALSVIAYEVGNYSAQYQKKFVIIDNKYAAIYINQNNGVIIPCILDIEKNTLEILAKEGYIWTLLNDKQQQYKKFDRVIVSSQ